MTHIVAGYPDMQTSEELVNIMDRVGVSFVEIQIPFSDPVADGPTLMGAQQVALENGTTPEDVFQLTERLQKTVKVPLLFMTYFNVVHSYGVEAFCKRAGELGVYGLIVPDMPMEEEQNEHYLSACKRQGLHAIQIISPLTPRERLKKIAKVASGFVYCVSREGVTGSGTELNPNLSNYLHTVRQYIDIPIALGFGISTRDHVLSALESSDIAVIGSAVVDVYNKEKKLAEVEDFLTEIMR